MASDAPKGAQAPPSGPPYLPQTAQSGGLPTPIPDDPIIAVLLLFFVGGAVTNMTIFQLNRRRDHKFIPSALLFGFCMARIVALSMRMAWASHPTNINVAIAANIFTAAGVLLLFVINIVFTQRIVRAYHPTFGWHRATHWTFLALYFSIIASLIMVITSTVHSFFTLDLDARQKDRDVQLFAGTYLAVMAFLPIPVVILAILFPRQNAIEKFGRGPFRHKLMLLLFTATLLSFGAGFRIGVNFAPRPASDPAWYHHKAAFYTVNFVIELIVVYTYAISRFDQRFHIPNGSSAPGHYSGAVRKNSDDQHLDSAAN
ncbi:hypothetical protein B0T26DRAFT_736087 [Lasiosphaeria miniovina]|uniref:DUF7702 domain-containing protein n=1 Tax=Lasiosphaeria miniovina TaxID=1954250 RepID=A0AA40BEV9_9PEZI|nr:uncharacterized protein B0T26DRAFT_736087 [Lasiosphaeria miniovina]KAK0732976.1 hypothetical protein B0T26DRAFT_736087 [Lasiosphaeria miniovina]